MKIATEISLYEIISLIIMTLGTIATFAAVFVALWQTRYANRKRLKCTFIQKNTVVNPNSLEKKHYVIMDISNIGNKKIIVNNWGIKLQESFILILTSGFEKDAFDRAVSIKTPYALEPEENITFAYSENLFKQLIKENIGNGNINPNKKIKFVVHDSTGKSYYTKSKYKARLYLEQNQKENT